VQSVHDRPNPTAPCERHETYFVRGRIEGIYLELAAHPLELGAFAPREAAGKSIFPGVSGSACRTAASSAVGEDDLYRD
jgi:hypothetical protein